MRLQFNRAIYLQPLTPEQIDGYFEKVGNKLTNLRAALQRDEALQNLAQTPLMLNIMSLAYQDSSAEDLGAPVLTTEEARRQHLFDTYIARMFKRKGSRGTYDPNQTKGWLSWLARNMQLHNQELFLMEGLQPSWLKARRWRLVYILTSRLLGGLVGRLSVGLFFGLIGGLSLWLNLGLSVGVTVSFIDFLRLEWLDKRRVQTLVSPVWWSVINVVVVWLSVGRKG